MNKVTYQVPGISCGHCVNTIVMEVGEMDGVLSVSGDIESKSVVIEYQDPASEEQLIGLLKEINYPALVG